MMIPSINALTRTINLLRLNAGECLIAEKQMSAIGLPLLAREYAEQRLDFEQVGQHLLELRKARTPTPKQRKGGK